MTDSKAVLCDAGESHPFSPPTVADEMQRSGAKRPRAELKQLSEGQKGYIAGIIDGEGCIDITTAGERYNLRVVIKTTSEPLALWLIEATGLGAKLQERQDKRINAHGKRRQKNYEWRVFTNQALSLLEAVSAHVVVKKKQVACAIEFQQLDLAGRKARGKEFQTRLRREHLPAQHNEQAPETVASAAE